MKRYKALLPILLLPVILYAQQNTSPMATDAQAVQPDAGHYLVALVAGVILAVAFQLILTNLSVAAGLNVMSTVTSNNKKGGGSTVVSGGETPTVGESIRTVSSAFGIWALVTASIALFFASWLASELSLTSNGTVGAVLGLVIWGLFYVAMMTIEVSAVSSLVGSLVRLAASGFRSAYNMTASVFSKSEETKVADTAAKVAGAVREEIFGDTSAEDIKDQIQKYVNQLKPQKIDPAQIANEFSKLLDKTEIRAIASHNGPYLDSDTLIATLRTHGYDEMNARSIANNLNSTFSKFKEESSTDKDKVSKVADTAMRTMGMSSEEAQSARIQIETYLKNTGKEELHPDAIKRDIEKLFSDPKGAVSSLKDRMSHIDRDTIAGVISQRQDISKEEANKIIDNVMNVINRFTSKASDAKEGVTDMKDSILMKLKNYMDSLGKQELEYDGVSSDLQKLFHDPKAGTEALIQRLKSMDRDTIKAIISSRKDLSEEDAERILTRVETARDNVMQKVDMMKSEINRRLEDAKQEAIHQADEVRKTASTAAWWAFGSAVVSGIAAVMGGMIGV